MKNPWYWKCDSCGAIQPAHPDTKTEEMGKCRKWVCKCPRPGYDIVSMDDYGPCGGTFVKHCMPESES